MCHSDSTHSDSTYVFALDNLLIGMFPPMQKIRDPSELTVID